MKRIIAGMGLVAAALMSLQPASAANLPQDSLELAHKVILDLPSASKAPKQFNRSYQMPRRSKSAKRQRAFRRDRSF